LKPWISRTSTHKGLVPGAAPAGARAAATFAARLTFDKVARRYGETMALSGVDLDIAPGEVVCLLGPSGCGKTTLLRVAAGIEKPSGGRVLINDREVAGPNRFVPPEERGIGLMFQDFALFPHLTILGNVAFGLKALPKAEARREALAALQRVGLRHLADEYPHILSGGQQQRVALRRAVPRSSTIGPPTFSSPGSSPRSTRSPTASPAAALRPRWATFRRRASQKVRAPRCASASAASR
jgi:iron(III) transport system ATP-binding protein